MSKYSLLSLMNKPPKTRILSPIRLARWFLSALALITFTLTLIGTILFPAFVTEHPEVIVTDSGWTPEMFESTLEELGLSLVTASLLYAVPSFITLLAGGILALIMLRRKGDKWFGLYATFVLILTAQNFEMYRPLFGQVAVIDWWIGFHSATYWRAIFVFLMVFPDGQFVPRWSRWTLLGWFALGIVERQSPSSNVLFIGLAIPLVALALGSQLYRYFWRSNAGQRQQTKWVIGAFLILFAAFPLAVIISRLQVDDGTFLLLVLGLRSYLLSGAALIPLSMGLAILRYRLFDIDVIIRKTLIYGLLTMTLGLVYFIVILVLQSLVGLATDENSPLVIVLSTLIIAALFSPLRRRIQRFIDQRFYRQRYDAQQVLATFGRMARSEVAVDTLTAELVRVLGRTVRPERVSVWLSPAGPISKTKASPDPGENNDHHLT